MRTPILYIVFLLFFSISNAQITKKMDSLYYQQWQKNYMDIDSLSNPSLEPIVVKDKDSIISKPMILSKFRAEELPITPYRLMHFENPREWFFYGQNNLTFNQSSFSNWRAGGNNNIGVLGKINYTLTMKKNRHFWENNVQLGYGLVSLIGQYTRKTEDFINISTNYGYELRNDFYLSAGYQFLTQFSAGYNYQSIQKPKYDERISEFLAPAYLNLGFGFSYNPKENFQVIFRPLNGKFTIVTDSFLQKKDKFGLEHDGQSIRKELGAMLNVIYKLPIYKDIFWLNQVNFFTNYLNHIERVDVSYNGLISIKFNRLISALVNVDMVYDHDQIQKLQFKQALGIGISYHIGLKNKDIIPKKTPIRPFVQ